jgi:hypothetical protein
MPGPRIDPFPGITAALSFQRVLQAADGVLDLAFSLVALAIGGQLGIATPPWICSYIQ